MSVARSAFALLALYGGVASYTPVRETVSRLHVFERIASSNEGLAAQASMPVDIAGLGDQAPLGLDPLTVTPAEAGASVEPGAPAPLSVHLEAPPLVDSHPAGLDALKEERTDAPTAITIADINVASAPVLATTADTSTGRLVIPSDASKIGWYRYGPTPGEPGSALLAGHVDYDDRPGVFYSLQDVPIGALVDIAFADGSVEHFRVTQVLLVDKTDIPVTDLFARSGSPRLTLVTCGGVFDWTHHTYRSNVIVSADPVPAAAP